MSETAQDDEKFYLTFSTAMERALVLATGAMALAFLGAATAIWAYPYPRALLMMASDKSFEALKLAGLSALLPVVIGLARYVFRVSVIMVVVGTLQGLLILASLYWIARVEGEIGDFALCARHDPEGVCNLSVERRATQQELDSIRNRLQPK